MESETVLNGQPLDLSLPHYSERIKTAAKDNAADTTVSEKIRVLRAAALAKLPQVINEINSTGIIMDCILNEVADMKCRYISQATTIAQIREILRPPPSRYNGNGLSPTSEYHVDAEEMCRLATFSLEHVPSVYVGSRILYLVRTLLPEKFDDAFTGDDEAYRLSERAER